MSSQDGDRILENANNDISTGERVLQEQVNRVRDYNGHTRFFNLVIPPLMLQEWSLVDDAEQELDFISSYSITLKSKINALFTRLGLPIPEPTSEETNVADSSEAPQAEEIPLVI